METGYFKDTNPAPELKLDETAKAYLLETARWAKFISILGFIFLGFYMIGGIAYAYIIISSPELSTMTKGIGATGMFLFYALFGFIIIYPVFALYKYTVLIKHAIKNTDTMTMNDAFRYHRNYYRYNGIITIILIGLYALVFIIMIIIGGIAAGS